MLRKSLYPTPVNLKKTEPQPERPLLDKADVYISAEGSDENGGTKNAPVASFEKARDILREKRANGAAGSLTAAVFAGEYRMSGFTLGEEDSDTCWRAYGNGEVLINGGITLSDSCIVPLDKDELSRLHGSAPEKVIKYDLKKGGLTRSDWDEVYMTGTFSSGDRYDSFKKGVSCEVFCNGERMTLARYPDAGQYLKLDSVPDVGDVGNWSLRNPKAGRYGVGKEVNERIKTWASREGIWMFGWFACDWADSSTPVLAFDTENATVDPEYLSNYAAVPGGRYYFFNVFDELDAPGEYFIDRVNGSLYIFPTTDKPFIEMSLTTMPLIQADGVKNVTLDGFTLKCTRSDGIKLNGSGCVIENCFVHDVFGDAMTVNGLNNTVRTCEITHTGKGGIRVKSGNRDTHEEGRSVVENNLIHDWSEVYLTYQPAISIDGVANRAAHNEMYNSPHTALTYNGNDNIIEYNVIHDVVKRSSDAGAIYTGREWFDYGNIVRYNCIYNITGDEGFCPNGIYWDDMLAGQTAYGNALINVADNSFLIGGGRNNRAFYNLIANAGNAPFNFDARGRDGLINNGWFKPDLRQINKYNFREGFWKQRYPQIGEMHDDLSRVDEPEFCANPAGGEVIGNLIVSDNPDCHLGWINDAVYVYCTVSGNRIFTDPVEAGLPGIAEGDYSVSADSKAARLIPGFMPIPFSDIGRAFERR